MSMKKLKAIVPVIQEIGADIKETESSANLLREIMTVFLDEKTPMTELDFQGAVSVTTSALRRVGYFANVHVDFKQPLRKRRKVMALHIQDRLERMQSSITASHIRISELTLEALRK